MKQYIPSLILITAAILFQVLCAEALTTSTIDPASIVSMSTAFKNATGTPILYYNNGMIDVVPNTSAQVVNGSWIINEGDSASYANPNGRFNVFNQSTTSDPVLSASFMASTTNYMQVFLQNLAQGGNASADLIIANDKGSATSSDNYADYGCANTGQFDSTHTLLSPLDCYLYNQSGRLILGSGASNASSSVIVSPGMASTSPYTQWNQYGQIINKGNKPTCSSGCGTGPTVNGTNMSGTISLGAGISVTAATMTFADGGWPSGTNVSCSGTTNSSLTPATYITSISNASVTFGLAVSLGGGKIYYQCWANTSN